MLKTRFGKRVHDFWGWQAEVFLYNFIKRAEREKELEMEEYFQNIPGPK